jgi:hypothetical protein
MVDLTLVFSNGGDTLGDGLGLTAGVAGVGTGADSGPRITFAEGAFVFWGAYSLVNPE